MSGIRRTRVWHMPDTLDVKQNVLEQTLSVLGFCIIYKNVLAKPNGQCQACVNIVMARIENRRHGTLAKWKGKTHFSRNENRTNGTPVRDKNQWLCQLPLCDRVESITPHRDKRLRKRSCSLSRTGVNDAKEQANHTASDGTTAPHCKETKAKG